MITERLLDTTEKILKLAQREKVDQTQATAFMFDTALTRFANSQIHQNVASKRGGVAIKVAIGKKIGTLRINTLEEKQIKDAVKRVVKIAKVTPPNNAFKSLPEPEKWNQIEKAFDSKTAACSPDYRAERVGDIIETAHKSRIVKAVAGSFFTGSIAYAISNSLGVSAWARMSQASVNVSVISESKGSQGFGSAEQFSRFVEKVNHIRAAEEATEKSVHSVNPTKISPGEYGVVLSPRAVGTFVTFLAYIGFSALPYQNGESFVKYHLNERVFDEKFSVTDDARSPEVLFALPIDGEGVPKKTVHLIDRGTVSEKSVCYDSFTAGKEKGKKSNGYSVPPIGGGYPFPRPLPINLIVDAGKASVEEMISETKHGIFVTRFHYTNPAEPTKAVLTGLTRDGTFLIENGEITKPIVNLRYTDSMLSALKDIKIVGKKREIVGETTAPALSLQKLRFTGVTA